MSRTLSALCVLLVLVSGQEPETKLISSEITLDLEIQIEVKEPDNARENNTREDKLGPTIEAVEATLYEEEDFEDYEGMENENVSTKSDNVTLPILVSKGTTGGLSNISVTSQPSDLNTSQNMSDKSTTNKERTIQQIQQNMTMMESLTTFSDERTFESDNGYAYGNNATEGHVNSTVETVKRENYSSVSLVQLLFFFIFVFVMGKII